MRRHTILNKFFSAFTILYLTSNAYAVSARHTTGVTRATQGVAGARSNNAASPNNVSNRGRSATPAKGTVSARAAVQNKTVGTKPVVAARAGATQKVVGTGTKVAGATKNIVVSEECQNKYDGCMDSFCMLENENGGRCNCDNKIFELNKTLTEIEKLDEQSYQLATIGVETIETGVAIASVATTNKKDKNLDFWSENPDEENKQGNSRLISARELCVAQIPECASDMQMLQMMYSQKIKSDCTAYENSLKQKKNASVQKLAAAEQALRETALEQLRTANKYDLGQCTVEFKKCMQTTGGCGDDFSSCAVMSALDATNTRKSTSKQAKNYQIKGTTTNIEISASTYDNLMAKKPLCESVTKSCVNVADKVWDTFLKEIAPQLKNAELIAEDKARQDCVGNISSCFQKACKDNIDPNDPDGSYDMCLTRPESMLNLCKNPLNACGIDASSREKAEESNIWDYVLAQLASMRVNACTNDVRNCLQADDRCGKDYTQCIGLDTDTIIRMCPYDKLVGCQKVYGETNIRDDAVYDELFNMVQGIMLNIDNNFLTECQNALTEATIRVCGDADSCASKTTNQYIGAQTLEYKICPYVIVGDDLVISNENCYKDQSHIPDEYLGRVEGSKTGHMGPVVPFVGNMGGIIYWSSINVDSNGKYSTIDEYIENAQLKDIMTPLDRERVQNELNTLQKNVDSVITAIESDPTVQYCMTGRAVKGMKDIKMKGAARFPELTKQTRIIIANTALSVAKENYYKKYDELSERLMIDYGKIAARQAEIRGENKKDAYREAARQACISMAQISALPRSPTPPGGVIGKIIIGAIIVAAIVVASVFTFGAAGIATGAATTAAVGAGASTSAAATVGTAAVTAATTAGATATTAGVAGFGAAIGAGVGAGTGLTTMLTTASAVGFAAGTAATASLATSAVIAGVAAGVGAAAVATETALLATTKNTTAESYARPTELTGYYEMNQWNYEEKITTTFNWDDIECEKCIEYRHCAKPSVPIFGNTKCKRWNEPETKCTTTKF